MSETSPSRDFFGRALPGLLIFLSVSAAYLYAFPQPNVFYAVVVLLHAVAGVRQRGFCWLFFFSACFETEASPRAWAGCWLPLEHWLAWF